MVDKLAEEARVLAVNKNLNDVTTLLVWAHDSKDPAEKARHIERAIMLLEDVHAHLTAGKEEDVGDDFIVI